MKQNLKIATEFAKKIKGLKGIITIVLFGSVARGEDDFSSDVDIAILFDKIDKYKLSDKVNNFKHDKIQLSFFSIGELSNESEIASALGGEGIILYGEPLKVNLDKKEIKPKVLISYDLSKLKQTEKVKLNRALYGSVSRSEYNGKKYMTEVNGLVNEEGIEKVSKGVLLVDRRKSAKIINLLKRFKAEFKERSVWGY